jgi:uncharacterized protein (TIGR00369 family)
MDVPSLQSYLGELFPDINEGELARVVEIAPGRVRLLLAANPRQLRPGGVVGGPAQMTTADVAMYALVLAHVGKVAMAVTTSLTIHFLRPAVAGDLVAEARLLKLGRRIVTGQVTLWTEEPDRPCAEAMVAYALP